ncbi:serine hydrolase domain-containing protein [Nocardia sp. NBC_01327]|uniref:serine hydrolase domain-containing protein n=1 Tax=Nocardia sp. NBC_01327 TaxID=2903593 RepID=UPI002E1250EE|nr:beta-lactamase family protein [Nocardia sp. NBC_01327]
MSEVALSEFVAAKAEEFGLPGVAVGVWVDGAEVFATHGVTSLENPLPVDRDTVFVLGSVSKTYTATALMGLVAEGRVELDAPVRRYIPEFTLPDEQAAADITVLNLLNHTAGMDWRQDVNTGEGDDALAAYAAKMADFQLIGKPGERASYSQAGFDLAGRIIEKVTGQTFEQAITSLVLEPLGMTHSFYFRDDVMTRRFAVGHNLGEDGTLTVVRPWSHARQDNPGGGLASSVADQLRWARFHLGDGTNEDGTQVIGAHALAQMKQQTVELRASTLGDGFGVCWFLKEIGGVQTIGHGGSAMGQFADLLIVPERNFAIVVTSNAGPDAGMAFNRTVVKWALEHYLDVVEKDPEPLPFDEARASEVAGAYENDLMTITIGAVNAGLTIECKIKPEVRAAADTELPPDMPVADLGLLPSDEYIVTSGGLQGQRGFFSRNPDGTILGADLAGRLFTRVSA